MNIGPEEGKKSREWLTRQAMDFRPRMMAIFMILAFIGLIRNWYLFNRNVAIPNQIEKLDQVSKDLESLQLYVKDQKKNLINQEQILKNLKAEKAEIEPLLNANKEVVDALFLQQAKNQKSNVWWERGYGFLFGMIASLVASILYDFLKMKYVKREEKYKIIDGIKYRVTDK